MIITTKTCTVDPWKKWGLWELNPAPHAVENLHITQLSKNFTNSLLTRIYTGNIVNQHILSVFYIFYIVFLK